MKLFKPFCLLLLFSLFLLFLVTVLSSGCIASFLNRFIFFFPFQLYQCSICDIDDKSRNVDSGVSVFVENVVEVVIVFILLKLFFPLVSCSLKL